MLSTGLPEFRISGILHFKSAPTNIIPKMLFFFLKAPTPRVPSTGIFCVRYLTFLFYACVFIRVRTKKIDVSAVLHSIIMPVMELSIQPSSTGG